MGKHTRELPSQSAVDGFHDSEVGREDDVKVSLVDLENLKGSAESRLGFGNRSREKEIVKLTRGVLTGTVRLSYLVWTTGALIPGIASGS